MQVDCPVLVGSARTVFHIIFYRKANRGELCPDLMKISRMGDYLKDVVIIQVRYHLVIKTGFLSVRMHAIRHYTLAADFHEEMFHGTGWRSYALIDNGHIFLRNSPPLPLISKMTCCCWSFSKYDKSTTWPVDPVYDKEITLAIRTCQAMQAGITGLVILSWHGSWLVEGDELMIVMDYQIADAHATSTDLFIVGVIIITLLFVDPAGFTLANQRTTGEQPVTNVDDKYEDE